MRLGIDVGGTFTDLAVFDDRSGAILTDKVLTTADPAIGALVGVRRLRAQGLDTSRVTGVIHGTTLITNALVERQGARCALVATKGFRDILYFRDEYRYDVYDPNIAFPEPLIPRHLRMEVTERLDGMGEVLCDLDEDEAREMVRAILREGVEAVAVCFLHSYLNAQHELRMREILSEEGKQLSVSLSHEVLPQIREYPRMSATVINAYVQPLLRGYLMQMEQGLRNEGIEAELHLMTSSGGTITVETATQFPIQMLESGPAAGAIVAAALSRAMGENTALSFDMGGTTAKACVSKRGRPLVTKGFEVARVRRFKRGSGLPVGLPVIDMLEIGAGGGSIAEIDEFGLLRIGPHSAGSRPGPACYDRGGNEPTVTDACLVLGFLNPEYFLGGEMALNADAAASAIEAKIARPLGMDVVGAAEAIHRVVIENMTEAARVHAVEMNVDLRGRSLIAFGGAGPIHAYGVAERLGVSRVVCPPQAGVLSALGLLAAPLSFEFAKTQTAELQDLDSKTVNQILESLETLGTRLLRRAGVSEIAFERSVDMCYSGQGYEVTTPIEAERFRTDQTKELGVAFENVYEETYGRRLTGLDARCITWRVLASGPRPELHFASLASSATPRSASPKTTRRAVFADTGSVPCAVYERSALGVGSTFNGPALIEDRASTIVIPPLLRASVDSHGNVIFTPTPSIGELETAKTRRAHRSRNRCECS